MTRILIADDHAVVRAGYRRLFELNGAYEVVGEASSGKETVSLFKELLPDIVVLDVMMPGIGVANVIQRITNHKKNAIILIVTLYNHISLVDRCFKAGACGYVTKSSSGIVLMEALKEVAKGRQFLSPDIAGLIALNKFSVGKESALSMLTPKEFDIFLCLAKGQSIAEISTLMHLSKKTVSNYSSKIKKKFNMTTTVELVHLALQENLISFS